MIIYKFKQHFKIYKITRIKLIIVCQLITITKIVRLILKTLQRIIKIVQEKN